MEKQSLGHWWRTLRPLFWWGLIVLVLLGIHTHQLWMEKTRLTFNAILAGLPPAREATATFDGQLILSGQKIPLGHHVFQVTHPKGETFSTNLFIWYGPHNFGIIDLKRTMGTLAVAANPPADQLVIRGPDWSVTLTNSPGLTNLFPTDAYEIEAGYPRWQKKYAITVYAHQTSPCNFAPHFGGLKLDCNQADATFQLQAADGQLVANGNLPATLSELPAGEFKLMATHHGHQQTETVLVKADVTTSAQIDFQYGTVVIETSPVGVTVLTDNGNSCGATPLRLTELVPGNWNFTLQRSGYQSVPVSLTVAANQTSYLTTNLVSETYFHAVTTAREDLAKADYDHALQAADAALAASPGDAEALTLHREATGRGLIQHAKSLAQQGDYIGGGKELTQALQYLPDNAEARRLVADYQQHEPEQIARQRQERLDQPKKSFNRLGDDNPDSQSFEEHELKTSKPADEVASGIVRALLFTQPPFTINQDQNPTPDIHLVVATQKFSTGFLSGGERKCLIVVGQTKDDESQILFKVLEYQRHRSLDMNVPITQLPVSEKLIPLTAARFPEMSDKVKAQLQAGVSNVTAIIQGVIGRVPAMQPAHL
jgi:tetratricopeptide (TPR) repeat protein